MGNYKILFIHGAGGTKSKWRTIKDYPEISNYEAIDLPGHGENEFNLISSVQDYAASIDQTIQEDTIVVGHSMGGLIALELAARNSRVKAVVLAASFYELPVHPKILGSLADGEFPESLFNASYYRNVSQQLLQEEKEELNLVPVEITHADFKACNDYKEGGDILESLKIPVYAILGKQDKLLPKEPAESLKKLNPAINIIEIDESGHYIMLEQPEKFAEALTKVIQELEKQTV